MHKTHLKSFVFDILLIGDYSPRGEGEGGGGNSLTFMTGVIMYIFGV